jgi:hypothetical protein
VRRLHYLKARAHDIHEYGSWLIAMNGRVFIKAFSVGALILGASAALTGCGSSGGTGNTATSGGSTQTAATTSMSAGASQSSDSGASGSTASATSGGAGVGASGATASATGDGGSAQNADAGSNGCATGHVSVKLGGSDAGLTHRSLVLLFTNSGSSTCTLTGYPGATVTNNGQYNFAPYVNAQRSLTGYMAGTSTVTTVSLAPGATASAILEWDGAPTDGSEANAANCPGMAGGYLEITPPNTTVASKFDPPTDMCTDIQIHPVVSGSSGRSAA